MKRFKFSNIIFFVLFLLGFGIRLYLTKFPGYKRDIDVTRYWAKIVSDHPIAEFYKIDNYHEYPPGILYILKIYQPFYSLIFQARLPDKLTTEFTVFHKGILIFIDLMLALLVGLIVYKLRKQKQLAILASLAIFLNPALFYDSVYWGQIDSLLALGVFISFFLLFFDKFFWAGFLLMLTALIKLQALILIPWLIIFSLGKNWKVNSLKIASGLLIAGLLVFLPFIMSGNFSQTVKMSYQASNAFPYFSLNALNSWWLIGGGEPWPLNSKPVVFNLSARSLGYIFFALSYFILLIIYLIHKRQKQKKEFSFWLWFIGLTGVNAFLLLTQMHERYLYLSVFVLSLLFFLSEKKAILLKVLAVMFSLSFLLNIAFVMNRVYFKDIIGQSLPFILTLRFSYFLSLIQIILGFFYFLTAFSLKLISRPMLNKALSKFSQFYQSNAARTREKETKLKNVKLYLVLLLLFVFISRAYRVGYPKDHIFDEVYHAFTAGQMAKGNIAAWEWWNTPPEGFAYEWTHPPLAKLIMIGGILLLGDNSLGWRMPAVLFGTGVILLTFLLAKQLFKNEKIALLAAFLLSFDGLLFVMSRVGMADVYLLFFMLAAILLSLKGRFFASAVFLGLAGATKWTGIYLYPAMAVILIAKLASSLSKNNFRVIKLLSYWLIVFILVPPLVYLLAYLPFFTSGHSWPQFVELQRQMWWYHTNLNATHDYQSTALSWPFMVRPVWFWVKYETDKIANIYNLGNPILWWLGLWAMIFVVFRAIAHFLAKKELTLIFLIFCYFIFWLPWLFSPRIMFLHHYLPSLPFLVMALSWFLSNELKNLLSKKWQHIFLVTSCLLVVLAFCFFYPIYTGILLPSKWLKFWFWLPSWR